MDIEKLKEISECGRSLYMLNDENLIECIRNNNQLQNYLSDSVDAIDETIARQSATSEEVESALCLFGHCDEAKAWPGAYYPENVKTAITALQAYQPTTLKDRIVEEVAISKTETVKCKCCICGDVFDVGYEMPNGDYVCATHECCYEYCKCEGKRITQESEAE